MHLSAGEGLVLVKECESCSLAMWLATALTVVIVELGALPHYKKVPQTNIWCHNNE